MKPWILLSLVVLLGACGSKPAATTQTTEAAKAASPTAIDKTTSDKATSNVLKGDDTGERWLTATKPDKLKFCQSSIVAYKKSAASSFNISVGSNNMTSEKMCAEIDRYYADKAFRTDRLGHAAGIAVFYIGKPYRGAEPLKKIDKGSEEYRGSNSKEDSIPK
jgi:type IV pilus biogenesis protein CpaD/CtpE